MCQSTYIPLQSHQASSVGTVSSYLHKRIVFLFYYSHHSSKKWYLTVLIQIFLVINDAENLCMCLLAIYVSSLALSPIHSPLIRELTIQPISKPESHFFMVKKAGHRPSLEFSPFKPLSVVSAEMSTAFTVIILFPKTNLDDTKTQKC